MVIKRLGLLALILALSLPCLAMARHGQYDEEAREEERLRKTLEKSERNNPAKSVASGVKEVTVDSTRGLISGTAEEYSESDGPVSGTLEGARAGSSKAVETAAKGVFKVATLGYGDTDSMVVEEPESNSDDVTKFKIGF